jgi:hypothetical protein
MRLQRYLNERIQNPPMMPLKYLKTTLKKLGKIGKQVYDALKVIKKYRDDDDAYEFVKEATQDLDLEQIEYPLQKINKEFISDSTAYAWDIGELLRTKDDGLFDTIFKNMISRLTNGWDEVDEYIRPATKTISKTLKDNSKRMDEILKNWVEYESNPAKYKEIHKMLKSLSPMFNEFLSFYDDFKPKMITWKKSLRHDYVPEHENVEELYHTSMYSKELLKNGFQKKIPTDRIGLGGATEGVSLTSDLKIAQDIARFLKEVIMIFNGQLKYRHILDYMKREGIDPTAGPERANEPQNVIELARFYEYYLTMSKMRTNPWTMWSNEKAVKAFFRRKVSDVAILKCKVDMTNAQVKFVKGEREYRVPPEAIISCRKL